MSATGEMRRRDMLALTGAALLAGCGRARAPDGLRVLVVGAGIIGASVAYHLALAGAAVTVIDREGVAARASRGTFAWLNASWAKQPRAYHGLNQRGVAGWHDLSRELGIPVLFNGSIEWFGREARDARLAADILEQAEWGEPARMLARAEMEAMEPRVDFRDAARAALSPRDGALDPVLATERLLAAATARGATLDVPAELLELTRLSGGVQRARTSNGSLDVDHVVLATGAAEGAAARYAGTDVPQRTTPGVIAITAPMPRLIDAIIVAPGAHIHQRPDGRVVIGEQDGAPEGHGFDGRLDGRPTAFPEEAYARQHFDMLRDAAARYVPGLADAQMESIHIGWRPLPVDGHPVLGAPRAEPGRYLAITHSGVSLAPVIGQLAAHEIVTGEALPELAPYRPDRAFETVRRY